MAAPFVDTAKITVRSGNGGNGVVSFHREKYVAAGGPDGGDGGRGGNVVVTVDDHMSTLMDFRYKRKYTAANGTDGGGKRCTGRNGADLVLRVPRGTIIRDAATQEIIHDMSDDAPFILCRGGRGGWGNQHFATPTRQVPRFAKAGYPGESREVVLELKLLADVGLVGFPNVGKSTLLSVVSRLSPRSPIITSPPFSPAWAWCMWRRASPSSWRTSPASLRAPPTAPDWATTFCATSTAAACSSMWWTSLAARAGTRWRTSRPSTPS